MTPHDRLQFYLVGFNDGFKHALSLHRQLCAAEAPASAPAEPASRGRSPSGLANGAVEAAKPPRRRGLRPSELRVLDFITSHPGCTGNEILAACKSVAPAYSLLRRRKVRRVEAPKPHTRPGPWVRFYPMEPTDAQA